MTVPPLITNSVLPAGPYDEDSIDAACANIRRYCRWHIAPSYEETVTLDGPGGFLLLLQSLHVTAVSAVTNDGNAVPSPEWSQKGMIRGSRPWTESLRGVTVTFTHGYEVCPDELLPIIASAAEAGYTAKTATGMQAGPFQASWAPAAAGGVLGLSRTQRDVLDSYRIASRP